MKKRLRSAFAMLLVLTVLPGVNAYAAEREATPLVEAVRAVGLTVGDMDRSLAFFTEVLSFKKVADVEVWGSDHERLQGVFGLRMRIAKLRLGEEVLELCEYLAPRGRPMPVGSRSNDRWFQHIAIVVADMDRAYQWLRKHKVEHASTGPQQLPNWNPTAAGIRAFYFKDPDGHFLEILQFPPGKGDARWHRAGDELFLGIDHTAIVVHDTDASLKFYCDLLGMKVVGTSENYGTEQEHLNNVFGARLRITTLRATSGPGIELLEYVTPRSGRAAPADSKPNDIWHWQITLQTRRLDAAAVSRLARKSRFISPGIVTFSDHTLGFARGLHTRDADGHASLFIEPLKGQSHE
jgi:catechol 2,3-dioxygenase-like lactoylglutathione lyase family enzyme